MRHPGRRYRFDLLHSRCGIAKIVEQPLAALEEDGDQGDEQLVEQSRGQVLLDGGRTASQRAEGVGSLLDALGELLGQSPIGEP